MSGRADLHRRRSVAAVVLLVKSLSKEQFFLLMRPGAFILSHMGPATATTNAVITVAAARKRAR
jgi:hypothetical protein